MLSYEFEKMKSLFSLFLQIKFLSYLIYMDKSIKSWYSKIQYFIAIQWKSIFFLQLDNNLTFFINRSSD